MIFETNLWIYFFLILVTCNIPRFFHYEYKHDEFGNGTYMATSLYRDKVYHLFWHTWQSLIYTFIPIIALCTINGKILWSLARSKQNDAEISQNNGLRIHVGWGYEISKIHKISTKLTAFQDFKEKAREKIICYFVYCGDYILGL